MSRIYIFVRTRISTYCPAIYKRRRRVKQLIKFIIAGGIASSVQLGLFYVFVQIMGQHLYLTATSLAFIFALMVSFTLQKFWTFADKETEFIKKQFTIYGMVALTNLFLNAGIMYYLVDIVQIWYIFAQIISMGILAIGSFIFHGKITFNNINENSNNNRGLSP